MFQVNYINGTPCGWIYKSSSFSGASYTGIGTKYAANNPSAFTGWHNFAIYIHPNGYMALWIDGNLVADVTDTTYPISSMNGTLYYGYQVVAGILAPAPVAATDRIAPASSQRARS